jgi:signal transduction histidine kinase
MAMIRRRTRLFISKKFQIRYISLILIFMFATAIITGYTVYYTTWIMFGEKLAAVYPQGLLLEIVDKVNAVLLLRLIFLSPLVILIGLVLSNRIAGPIYRIHKFVRKIHAGDYSEKLTLREKDELQDLAVVMNSLVAKLSSDREKRSLRLDELAGKIEDLETQILATKPQGEELASSLKTVMAEIRSLKSL